MNAKAQKKARNGQMVAVVVMFLGLMTGVMLFRFSTQMQKRNEIAKSWPQVEGKIATSKVFPKKKLNRVGRVLASTSEYVHEWTIDYEVNGKKYTRKSSWTYSSDKTADKERRSKKPGTVVLLHYNPNRPDDTQLHNASANNPWTGAAIGGVMFLFGALYFAWSSYKLKKLTAPIPGDARELEFDEEYDDEPDARDAADERPQKLDIPKQAPGMELESAKYFEALQK